MTTTFGPSGTVAQPDNKATAMANEAFLILILDTSSYRGPASGGVAGTFFHPLGQDAT